MSATSEEIALLERVLLRLGCADTDEQLENAVNKFLTPVLLKITSPHENVRLKVMEVLTHVNKRLKSRPLIQLPVEALLLLYKDTVSSFALNFAIIYITMGYPRLPIEKQTELAPILLNCLEDKPEAHQDKLLILILPLLGAVKIPEDPEKRIQLLGLSDKPATRKSFLSLILDVFLLPYGTTPDGEIPPGMSSYSFKRVIVNNWKADELENLKKGLVRFLCSGVFNDNDVLAPLIIASADTRFSVATPAIAELSKSSISLDWTNAQITAPLYILYSGNSSKIIDRKTSPCSTRVRQKLLHYLLKCRGQAINTVKGIQIIFESLFGENTNQKCKVQALQFSENLIKDSPKDLINKLSKVILSGLLKITGGASSEPFDVQIAAYGAVAQLARTCPDSINKDLQIVFSYFTHLSQAAPELHTHIREALVSMAPAFSYKFEQTESTTDTSTTKPKNFIPNSNQKLLLAMLADHAESKFTIVQNVAAVYLTTCYPEYCAPARFLLLIIGGETPQLKETIYNSLYGVSKKDIINYTMLESIDYVTENDEQIKTDDNDKTNMITTNKKILPNFIEMLTHVIEMAEKKASNPQQRFVYGKVVLGYSYDTSIEILDYLRLCLWYSANVKAQPGDEGGIEKLGIYIEKMFNENLIVIQNYIGMIKKILQVRRGQIELNCLYDICNARPNLLTEYTMPLFEILSNSLKEVNENTRIVVSQVMGIILGYIKEDKEFDSNLKELLSFSTKSLEHKHGCILTAAHCLHRRIIRAKQLNTFNADIIPQWEELKNFINLLISLLTSNESLMQSVGVKGLLLLGSIIIFPIPDNTPENKENESKMEIDNESSDKKSEKNIYTKEYLMMTLFKLCNNSQTKLKIREDGFHCLGHLAVGDGKYFSERVLKGFLKDIKRPYDPVIHIAIGQSMVYIVHGRLDVIFMDNQNESINPYCDDKMFEWLLLSIIEYAPKPSVLSKQACAVWLLAIIKNCSKRKTILDNKYLIQSAIIQLLSEDNEFIQDVASRALGLVFTLSDEASQTDLADSLLNQLTGGRKEVKRVAHDTILFEDGVLGKTPTGGNISTYKDLCSLASELNQPDLIYQFMQLANHNAMWQSKLGAAFGLQSMSMTAKTKMQPFIGKVVPRLYRYKYDPTPKIQNSMISIWDSIVTNSKETVEKYYWDILNELTINLTNNEWRVRIACCLGVRDLIKRPAGLKLRGDVVAQSSNADASTSQQMETDEEIKKVPEPELEELWSQLFRVMDDFHEGTRLAAEGTARTFSKVCIVASSSQQGKSGQRVASSILPVLLRTGVTHTVAEVRTLSIKTISSMIDTSEGLLVPHMPELVPCFLRATGELEVSKLSYLSARLGAEAETQEIVDTMRAEAAKQHYTMETLNKCIRHIDYESFNVMTPTILDIMKTYVNLGTKIACAHFICLVSIKLGKEMQPLVPKYMNGSFNQLKDRNPTVRKYYATTIGHLVGLAKEQTIINLFNKLSDFYYENDAAYMKVVPHVIQAINKRHPEILKDYSSNVLPLIFFAMHEEVNDDNRVSVEMWKDLWNDVSPGDAGIRLNLDIILENLEKSLEASSWLIKAQSANAINTLSQRMDTNLDDEKRIHLLNCLLDNLRGMAFNGKERILEAVATLCKHINKDNTELKTRIIDIVMRECRKEDPIYRSHALKALGDILDILEEDRFEEVYNMVWYLLDKQDLSDEMPGGSSFSGEQTTDERKENVNKTINLKEKVCEVLGKAWPVNSIETQEKYQIMFVEKCVECLRVNTRQIQMSLLVALGRFLEKSKLLKNVTSGNNTTSMDVEVQLKKIKVDADVAANNSMQTLDKICKDVLAAIVYIVGIPHTGLKKEALNILLILIKKLRDQPNIEEFQTLLTFTKQTFENILIILQKDQSPEIKCRLRDIEEKFA